ncbi:hypothetical protein GN244_ATG03153 [Phytophthora infestans]|uniref:Uncharacterized protein n=1 Tax=Phytophthora infestans TaxID=4787 RepID=A0A833TDM3_PHYIN|nr:hypothetical protein GN244_ATG03153 [Phytophthora infestans]
MWHYGEVTKLGHYSYSYELPDSMTQGLLSYRKSCPAFDANPSAPTGTTTPYAPPFDVSTSGNGSLRGYRSMFVGMEVLVTPPTSSATDPLMEKTCLCIAGLI